MSVRQFSSFAASLFIAAAVPVVAQAAADPTSGQSGAQLAPAAVSSTIYTSIDKSGRVVLTDRPDPAAGKQSVYSFRSHSDPESIARATRERDYWRAQAEAYDQRHRERVRAEDQRRLMAAAIHDSQAAQARYYGAPVPGVFYGGYGSRVGRPMAPHAWVQGQTLGSGPAFVQPSGAPAGSGPAPFLSSGFASGMRR